jgi:hypothetical protein
MLIGPPLAHRQVPVQPEVIDELAHHLGVLLDPVAEPPRAVRQPETEVIGCDAAELIPQAGDDPAIQEAPCRVAVEEHDDGTRALVDVMNAAVRAVEPPRGERVLRRVRVEINPHFVFLP